MDRGALQATYCPWGHKRVRHYLATEQQRNKFDKEHCIHLRSNDLTYMHREMMVTMILMNIRTGTTLKKYNIFFSL